MSHIQSEIQRYDVLRLSNEESNRITRECLETALIQLLQEYAFRDITITDIVKRAGVSRSAYYRNYNSKEDILNNLMDAVVKSITEATAKQAAIGNWFAYWQTLFTHVQPHAQMYITLIKADLGSTILEGINRATLINIPADALQERYRLLYWNGAIFNILTDWICNGMQQSAEELAKICQTFPA